MTAGTPLANPPSPPRRIESRDLLAGGKEIVIVHEGRNYLLRITQHGKLILTA
jgi:hemin uptake protein HemP